VSRVQYPDDDPRSAPESQTLYAWDGASSRAWSSTRSGTRTSARRGSGGPSSTCTPATATADEHYAGSAAPTSLAWTERYVRDRHGRLTSIERSSAGAATPYDVTTYTYTDYGGAGCQR
jgi:hypothetical protein